MCKNFCSQGNVRSFTLNWQRERERERKSEGKDEEPFAVETFKVAKNKQTDGQTDRHRKKRIQNEGRTNSRRDVQI